MKKITEITRRDIFDIIANGFVYSELVPKFHPNHFNYEELEKQVLKMFYWGRLDEIGFLKRLYKLDQMPSTDSRFQNAEDDIWQHTVNNDDWGYYWIFEDSRFNLSDGNDDKFLLDFLCEIFHPVVRDEEQPWQKFLDKFNELLKCDGYELYEKTHLSGRSVYGWREIHNGTEVVMGQIESIKEAFNTDYVRTQVGLMYQMINTAPHSAIGKAKELLEICCKTILDEQRIEYSTELDLTQ